MGISSGNKPFLLTVVAAVLLALSACGGGEGGPDTDIAPDSEDLLAVQAHLNIAELYRSQGQFRASTIEIQNALQIVPDNTDALVFLAQLSVDIGNNERAVELLTSAYEENPGDTQVLLSLAEAHLVSGNTTEAQSLLEGIELSPGSEQVELNLLLGTIAMRNGDLPTAEEEFQEALQGDSDNIDALILLSQIEAQSGAIEVARGYLEQAIAVDPEGLDVWIWRGQFAMLEEDYPAAEEAYSQALNLMALYDMMTAKRFTILQSIIAPLQLQQKDAEALQYTELLAETPQGQIVNNYSTALNMFRRGDMQQADEALSNILSVAPDNVNSNILLGMTRYAQGNLVEASDLLTRFVDVESAAPQLVKALAAARLGVNQFELAQTALLEALDRYPEDASLLAMLGVTQQSMGNFDESVDSLSQALALSSEADSAEMHLALAGSYFQMQNFSEAEIQLLESIRLNPLLQQAKTLLIDVYLLQENFDAASSLTSSWVTTEPDSIFNNEAAGVVALRQGNFDRARTYFGNILEVEPNHVQSRLTLGRVDLIEGNYQEAASRFESVLELEVDNSGAIGGLLAAGASRDAEESSIAIVQRIIDENESLYIPPLTLAQYFLGTNRLERSREYADIAIARENNIYTEGTVIDIMLADARLRRESQDSTEALRNVENVLSLREDHIEALTLAAALHADLGEYEQAKGYVAQIQELLPEVPFGHEVEGDLLLAEGDFEGALTAFERAWSLGVSPNLGVKLHDLYQQTSRISDIDGLLTEWTQTLPGDVTGTVLLGMRYQGQSRNNEAINEYERAYLSAPDNLLVLNNLAWLYQDSEPERALELASRGAELFPENADMLDTYGWILAKQNNRSEAITILEKALELSPQNQSVIGHLNTLNAEAN